MNERTITTAMGTWHSWEDTPEPTWQTTTTFPETTACIPSCWPCHPPTYWYPMYADDLLRAEVAALRAEVAALRAELKARRR